MTPKTTAGPAQILGLELSTGLSLGWQGSRYLCYNLLPSRKHLSRRLNWKPGSWDLNQAL